jgi:peptide/nickel transport system substrate-binding protein
MMLLATAAVSFTSFAAAQDDYQPFVYGDDASPGKLDPADAYDSASIGLIMQVCEGLFEYNYSSPEMESIPMLATDMGTLSPTFNGDMVNLTITLKEGVTFHDGTPFNASAVKWTFDRLQFFTTGIWEDGALVAKSILTTASASLFYINNYPILNTTEIESEYVVKFVLNQGPAIWEKLLAFTATAFFLPDADYAYGEYFNRFLNLNDDLIGTGPYMLVEYEFDNQVVFEYYPDYHEERVEGFIEEMIYLIVPDDVTRSLAILNYEIHWGPVIADYDEQWEADPNLIELPRKTFVVFYIQMNLFSMPQDIRLASSYAWNHTYLLDDLLGGRHYEIHVPVPDGMQYHHEGFVGEPYLNLTKAREYLINSADVGITNNLSAVNLDETNTTAEWRAVAESTTPVAHFNFTGYTQLGTLWSTLLVEDMKDIGIKIDVLPPTDWSDYVEDILENADAHPYLSYSFGGWGPDYNDPINMIEPLYRTNASSNCFMLADPTMDSYMADSYAATGAAREALFFDMQEYFVTDIVPSFYILQQGGTIAFNSLYVEETSVAQMLNPFRDLYWKNVIFYPPEPVEPIPPPPPGIPGFGMITLLGVSLAMTAFLVLYLRKRK